MATRIENQYYPDRFTAPGVTLQETLDTLNMTPAELASQIQENMETVTGILRGETALTPIIALKLEKALDIPASFWNNYEKLYRESLAKQKTTSVA